MGCIFYELLKLEDFIQGEDVINSILSKEVESLGAGFEEYDSILKG